MRAMCSVRIPSAGSFSSSNSKHVQRFLSTPLHLPHIRDVPIRICGLFCLVRTGGPSARSTPRLLTPRPPA